MQPRAERERSLIHTMRSVGNTPPRIGDIKNLWGVDRIGVEEGVVREMARVADLARTAKLELGVPFEALVRTRLLDPNTQEFCDGTKWVSSSDRDVTFQGIDEKGIIAGTEINGSSVKSPFYLEMQEILALRKRKPKCQENTRDVGQTDFSDTKGLPLEEMVRRAGLKYGDSFEILRETRIRSPKSDEEAVRDIWCATYGITYRDVLPNFLIINTHTGKNDRTSLINSEEIKSIRKSPPVNFYENKK